MHCYADLQNLRRYVVRGAHCGGTHHLAIGIHAQTGAKVSEFDVTILVYQNIVRLYVPVKRIPITSLKMPGSKYMPSITHLAASHDHKDGLSFQAV